ncbi:unnamed protein product [Closterium sp. Naga37s-1]|nr:unnamed protein product [Closterium sp. Naga37s-1]
MDQAGEYNFCNSSRRSRAFCVELVRSDVLAGVTWPMRVARVCVDKAESATMAQGRRGHAGTAPRASPFVPRTSADAHEEAAGEARRAVLAELQRAAGGATMAAAACVPSVLAAPAGPCAALVCASRNGSSCYFVRHLTSLSLPLSSPSPTPSCSTPPCPSPPRPSPPRPSPPCPTPPCPTLPCSTPPCSTPPCPTPPFPTPPCPTLPCPTLPCPTPPCPTLPCPTPPCPTLPCPTPPCPTLPCPTPPCPTPPCPTPPCPTPPCPTPPCPTLPCPTPPCPNLPCPTPPCPNFPCPTPPCPTPPCPTPPCPTLPCPTPPCPNLPCPTPPCPTLPCPTPPCPTPPCPTPPCPTPPCPTPPCPFAAVVVGFENAVGREGRQAMVFRHTGDGAAFYSCHLHKLQDTLYVHGVRRYHRNCYHTVHQSMGQWIHLWEWGSCAGLQCAARAPPPPSCQRAAHCVGALVTFT